MINKKHNLFQIITIILFFHFRYEQQILGNIQFQEQRYVEKQEPHYPSKVYIESQKGFQILLSKVTSVEVLYFSKNIKDNYYILIFNTRQPQQYQGIKFRISPLTNKLIFIEDLITPNLNFLLNRFGIQNITNSMNQYYPNLTQDILESYQFKQFSQQQDLEQSQDKLFGNVSSLDMLKEQFLAYNQIPNQQNNSIDLIGSSFNPNDNISTTILGTRQGNIRNQQIQNTQKISQNQIQKVNALDQFVLEQKIDQIPKKKALSALLPGISSWSLIKSNEMEFQIFLEHLKMVVEQSQQQYLEKNLSLLFQKYNLSLKNMNQYEIEELKNIIQQKIFQPKEAQFYINQQIAVRQAEQLFGIGYDFLVSTFLHLLKGGKQISQSEAVQLIEYTLNYGRTENLSYNEEIQQFFKDVVSILLIGKPNSQFISVIYDIMKKNKRRTNQLLQCKVINQI